MAPVKVEQLYTSMDTTHDGRVSYEEFRQGLMGNQQLDDDDFFSARRMMRGMMRLCTGVW